MNRPLCNPSQVVTSLTNDFALVYSQFVRRFVSL